MSHHKKPEHHIRPYKIAAQTAGLVACIFVLIFFAGNGIPEILKNEEKELIPFIPFLVLPVAGYIVACPVMLYIANFGYGISAAPATVGANVRIKARNRATMIVMPPCLS